MNKFSNTIWRGIKILFAIFIIAGGVHHFINPNFYFPFVPIFIPLKMELIYVAGVLIIAMGIFLFYEKYSTIAALGTFTLLALLLPIHVWGIFSDTPTLEINKAALIRLPFLFLFMLITWKIKQVAEVSQKSLY